MDVDIGFGRTEGVCYRSRYHIANEVVETSMSCVFYVALVFQDVVDTCDDGPLSQ